MAHSSHCLRRKLADPATEPAAGAPGRLLMLVTSTEPGRWPAAAAAAAAAAVTLGPFLTPIRSWAWKRESPPDLGGAAETGP
jgi:hypothetical protein